MKHRISILFSLLLCLSAAVAQDFGRSQRVLDWLQQQKGDSVYALCNAEMKAALSAQQLGGIYAQLVRQAGTENGRGEWERTVIEGGIEVDGIRLDFSQTSLMALLSWNGEGQLCGLFFRPTTPPQTVAVGGAENREVQIENGKIFLPGTLTLPTERKKPVALAVLLAGSGPCDRNETIGPNALLRDLADSLALHGIASIRYDKRTLVYGSACVEISGGMDYDKEIVDDALAALQQACALPEGRTAHLCGGAFAQRNATAAHSATRHNAFGGHDSSGRSGATSRRGDERTIKLSGTSQQHHAY